MNVVEQPIRATWRFSCTECGSEPDVLVSLMADALYEARLCRACLSKAAGLIDEAMKGRIAG